MQDKPKQTPPTADAGLTHLNAAGEANMVDVSDKAATAREATATSRLQMQAATMGLIFEGEVPKGDVLAVARIAGIQAAKRTSELIPLCHPLALTKVTVDFIQLSATDGIRIKALAKVTGQTGVEMEALTAASVAALTIYDMAKAVDRGMEIGPTRLLEKSGGKSGTWKADG